MLVAIAAAIAINAGYVVQHTGLASAPPVELHRPLASVAALLRSPRWLAGAALGYGGLALGLLALTALPPSTVPATIGAGLVVVAVLSRAPAGRAAPLGALLAVAALAVLAVVAPAPAPHAPAPWALAAAAVLVAGAAALAARRLPSPTGLGLAAGLL